MSVAPARVLRVRAAQSPQATPCGALSRCASRMNPVLHDHATPGRGAEAGERGRSKEPATATPRSQTQPGGHEAVKRRDAGTASALGLTLVED
ncbi:hypothetical protein [Dickeya zeae]|uniref:hypothetical protein n=1 Tax=Dickeya zeae TaxID=204042 RepID=UPI002096BD22|nr:hypothetical protein [Dickeya zeae]MCO7262633.1 hypothetical protein [Dickeya zeae]MCO7262640.1 hypothetical protein [Dickeya zeae]